MSIFLPFWTGAADFGGRDNHRGEPLPTKSSGRTKIGLHGDRAERAMAAEETAMATYQILRWQEIPSVVEARDDAGVKKRQLSEKFQVLIDEVAMRRRFAGTDAYLDQWNKTEPESSPGSAADVLARVAAEIEGQYRQIREEAFKKPLA